MPTERAAQLIAKVMQELNLSYGEALSFIERIVDNELKWMQQHPESEDDHVS